VKRKLGEANMDNSKPKRQSTRQALNLYKRGSGMLGGAKSYPLSAKHKYLGTKRGENQAVWGSGKDYIVFRGNLAGGRKGENSVKIKWGRVFKWQKG